VVDDSAGDLTSALDGGGVVRYGRATMNNGDGRRCSTAQRLERGGVRDDVRNGSQEEWGCY
jgi:hypothetical protein